MTEGVLTIIQGAALAFAALIMVFIASIWEDSSD